MRQSLGLAVIAFLGVAPPFSAAQPEAAAVYLGSYDWQRDEPEFGGFSGLELAPDGAGFWVLSDRIHVYEGRLSRGPDGVVNDVTVTLGPVTLHDSQGRVLHGETGDPEGLALAADGSLFVSFEGLARVARYVTPDAPAERLPRPEAFDRFQSNSALEALAIDAEGTLYTLPERSGGLTRPFPVFRYRNGVWDQPFAIPRDGDWLPVGADFGPDGRLYLLERDFWGILGFLTRVRRFEIGPDGPGPGEVLFETRAGRHDNLEGIATWRDDTGAIRLTMISDDNFSVLQTTEFVDYRVTE